MRGYNNYLPPNIIPSTEDLDLFFKGKIGLISGLKLVHSRSICHSRISMGIIIAASYIKYFIQMMPIGSIDSVLNSAIKMCRLNFDNKKLPTRLSFLKYALRVLAKLK